MTKEEARAWKARWDVINEIEREELRRRSPAVILRQLDTLMRWAKDLGWNEKLAAGEEEVRQRWIRLRKAYGA
jgi:hypothetical protein